MLSVHVLLCTQQLQFFLERKTHQKDDIIRKQNVWKKLS